jgi:hypothetical protein
MLISFFSNLLTGVMKIDLHNHTTFSDGELNLDELIQAKIQAGINLIAVTDHFDFLTDIENYLSSIKIAAGEYKNEIIVIPGIEIDILHQHVVVIGEGKIRSIFKNNGKKLDYIPSDNGNCVFIIAHPNMEIITEDLLKKAHAVEITFLGCFHPQYTQIYNASLKHNLLPLASSDTHSLSSVFNTHTDICSLRVRNEIELVDFIRQFKINGTDKIVKFYASDIRNRFI